MKRLTLRLSSTWYLSFIMIWSLALMTAGCSGAAHSATLDEGAAEEKLPAANPVQAGPESGSEPVNLRFTVWTGSEAHLAMLNEIAEAYRQTQPNVSVEFITIPFGDYVSKVTIQSAGGNSPDAGWIVESSAPTFVEAGLLADLGPSLKQDAAYDFADLAEPALQLWVREEAVYGIPFSTSPFIILYNRDLFEGAGLETPNELLARGEWSWEALADAARIIAANTPDGVYGFESKDAGVYGEQVWHTLVPLIRAYGGDAWDAGGRCLLDAPEAVEAVQLYHDMAFVDRSAVGPGENGDFYSGQAGMTIGQLSRVSKLVDAAFDWGVAPLPGGPAGEAPVIGQAAIVVFDSSQHKELAIDFVAFMTNKENVVRMAEFFPPARISVLESDALLEANPLIDPASMERSVIAAIKRGTVLSSHVEFPKISLAASAQFDHLWVPEVDVQAVLSGVCQAITPFLSQ